MTGIMRAQKLSEVPANRVTIRLGPEFTERLALLESIIRDYPHDEEMCDAVKDLTSGRPHDIGLTMVTLVHLKDQIEDYEKKTGDSRAMDAFRSAIAELTHDYRKGRQLAITVEPTIRSR